MIRAVVFDLWYTLVSPEDFRPADGGSARLIPEVLGLDPVAFDPYWADRFEARMRGDVTLIECVEHYLATVECSLTAEQRARLDGIWRPHDEALARVRDEVVQGLLALRRADLRTGLLSNVHDREVRGWPSSPLRGLFDEVCFSFELGVVKPEPSAYASVLRKLGVGPGEAAFVGDGASNELRGAREAGFGKVIFICGFVRELVSISELDARASDAHACVDRIEEVLWVVQE